MSADLNLVSYNFGFDKHLVNYFIQQLWTKLTSEAF